MEPKINDKDELITRCAGFFAGNPLELEKVEHFHRDYKPEKAFEWYTKDAFVYRLLNKALRTQNIDLLFLFRFFLQDMQNQLALYQEQSRIRVYRGQRLSKEEWKHLTDATGQYISMNSFLSTSLQRTVAEHYILGMDNDITKSEVQVLFQIEADPHLRGGVKPFANITRFSQFPDENEIVFMAGTVFQVKEVTGEESISIVRMELCSNEENDLKTLFDSLRSEYGGVTNEANLNSLGIVLFNMHKLDMADRFFRRIFHEASNNDPNYAHYCLNIGNVALRFNKTKESARWYERALKIHEINGTLDHLSAANLHLAIGNLYSETYKHRRALDSYKKALLIYKINFGDNHPKVAMCYHNMAGQFVQQKCYDMSIEYRLTALRVAENTLPTKHPTMVFYHLDLAKLLLDLRCRELRRALYHAETAWHIAETTLPPDHPIFLDVYVTLGQTYELMKDVKQSTIWYTKFDALNVLHPTNIRIQRVDKLRTEYICTRCHQLVWVWRPFERMKDIQLNCVLSHEIGFFCLNILRSRFHYQGRLWPQNPKGAGIKFYPAP